MKVSARINSVKRNSPAWRAGVRKGDILLSVNGKKAVDILSLLWEAGDGFLDLGILRNGSKLRFEIEMDDGEPLGLEFASPVFDRIRTCSNNCVFCFVHQQPSGLRPSLYVKDDDYRLSFLSGSYITLSNLGREDEQRIADMRLSPLYVSVHASDEGVRKRLLGRKKLAPLFPILSRLSERGVCFWTQVVLVPGYNDGAVLVKTLRDLLALYPAVLGTAVVPLGLTCHRSGLPRLSPVDKPKALEILDIVADFQKVAKSKTGGNFCFPADEFFILGGTSPPPSRYYENFHLVEDGVGLLRRFQRSLEYSLSHRKKPGNPVTEKTVTIITGKAAAPFFRRHIVPRLLTYGSGPITVKAVPNRLFGGQVTVAGLLCGRDIVSAFDEREKPGLGLLCEYAIREGTDKLLDDMTLPELEKQLGFPVEIVADSGAALARRVLRPGVI